MSDAPAFCRRMAFAAICTAALAYAITAFSAWDWRPAHWSVVLRTNAALGWLTFGGIASLIAGLTAVRDR